MRFLVLTAMLLVVLSGCSIQGNNNSPLPAANNNQSMISVDVATNGGSVTVKSIYKLEQVAQHGVENDCWVAINDKVYDITAMLPSHPGGPAIIDACGKDATQVFESQPVHAGKTAQLDQYYLGDLGK